MKRKTTNLEQRLIDKGYYLSHKSYMGSKSQKTLSYTYVRNNGFVKLDYKREKVLSYGLLNYHAMELTLMEWHGIKIALDMIKNDFSEQPNDYDLEMANAMTPEWFESENDNGKEKID